MAQHSEVKIGKIGRKIDQGVDYREINSNSITFKDPDLLNAFSRLAILIVLAGYEQCDYIFIDDRFNDSIDLKKLSRYLSYVLNHRELAPRKFCLRITERREFKAKDNALPKNNYDGILSFSGGIDSTAGLLNSLDKGQSVQPLWISFGQRNDEAELAVVRRILARLKINPLVVAMDIKKYILKGWKDWDYIIPGRNFLFISLADAILKHSIKSKNFIYLCAHKDEMKHRRNTDKSRYFFAKASSFFSLDSGKEVVVATPFANVSKTEILSYWKKHWIKKYKISPHDTTTCYYGRGCGRCEVCLKRTVSLLASGFGVDPFIRVHPLKDPSGFIVNKWVPQIKEGKFTRIKKLDFLIAVEKCLKIVPPKVKHFYNNLSIKTLLAIKKRKEEIKNAKI